MNGVYLDNNATTRPLEEVVVAMREIQEIYWANPSSVHRPGQAARQRVELARESVARLIGGQPREIIFTSGGTESAGLALLGSLGCQPHRRTIVTSRIEHSAIREWVEHLERGGVPVRWLDAGSSGAVAVEQLASLLEQEAESIALVSVMWANNETGAIQPVEALGELCHRAGVRFHTDATQWVGKMPTDVSSLPIDLLTFSAHKFHGPKGIGALYVRRGVRVEPQILGGPQERQRRAGTEHVAGIVGFGVAAAQARRWLVGDDRGDLAGLRDRFESGVLAAVPGSVAHSASAERLWNTSTIGVPGLEAEAILMLLSERGLCASAGAACSSGSIEPSAVLLAMGIPAPLAYGSTRFSLSRFTTAAEIDEAIETVSAVMRRLQNVCADPLKPLSPGRGWRAQRAG